MRPQRLRLARASWDVGFAATEITTRPALADALTPSNSWNWLGAHSFDKGKLFFLTGHHGGPACSYLPAETHDVDGGPYPDEWEYRLTLGGPSRTFTYPLVPASLASCTSAIRWNLPVLGMAKARLR